MAEETAAGSSSQELAAEVTTPKPDEIKKVEILLKATGDAPILKKKKWVVEDTRTIGWVTAFLRKVLKLPEVETLFLYVNQSFAPAPDEVLQHLYSCFGSDNKLVLHYSKSQAWG